MGMPGHILVVEDAPAIAEVLDGYLTLCGFTVRAAVDGSEALEYVETHRPDLVITDVAMPKCTGTELTRRLRAEDRPDLIPVVIFTGLSPDDDDIAEVLRLPLVRLVQKGKPFRLVRDAVEQLLSEAAQASFRASLP